MAPVPNNGGLRLPFPQGRSDFARKSVAVDRAAFAADGRTRDAAERCLERICEAAHRLGSEAEHLMPEQPWADIRGMGNRLRHAYDRVSFDVIWNSIETDLPALASDVR